MKLSIKKSDVITGVCYLYILLFTYAAASKLFDFQNFQVQLSQSPLISAFASFLSWIVPLLELIICVLLILPKTRMAGLYASYFLMAMFTFYIYIILNYSSFVPCSCGGILEKLSWNEHLIFNLLFILLAILALWPIKREEVKTARNSKLRTAAFFLIPILAAFSIVIVLYSLSENIVHYHNTLTRRFPHTPLQQKSNIDLRVSSYYIAGTGPDRIYLGNTTAPLLITVVNDKLQVIEKKLIEIEPKNYIFHGLSIIVQPPYFFVTDGTVPVIYGGKISDWRTQMLKEGGEYFAAAAVIDSVSLAVRTHSSKTGESILGVVHTQSGNTTLNPSLLQKQFDGVFDLDGQLHYNPQLRQIIYLYAYRNQYAIADNNLKLIKRGNTIDTISKAKIKVVSVKDRHIRKLAAPPLFVNRSSAVSGYRLFVNSAVPGKFEKDALWKSASIIDVYDLRDGSYQYSFCIYDIEGKKARSFTVQGNQLYALIGRRLFHCRLDLEKMKRYEK